MKNVILHLFIIIAVNFVANEAQCETFNIKLVFINTQPSDVKIFGEWIGGWPPILMNNEGNNVYVKVIRSKTSSAEFNIEFKQDGVKKWVASYEGIYSAKVYVNDFLLNDQFLVLNQGKDGCNFFINQASDGTLNIGDRISKFGNVRIAPIDAYIKEHSKVIAQRLPSHKYILACGSVIHDLEKPTEKSLVEIDYLVLKAKINGKYEEISRNDYNGTGVFDLNLREGGFFVRDPWYDNGNESSKVPLTKDILLKNGSIVIEPSSYLDKNKIFHWWNFDRSLIDNAYEDYIVEARIKITGPAFVQLGLDYYSDKDYDAQGMSDKVKHLEIGLSDWAYNNITDWQILRFYTNLDDREKMGNK